MKFKFFKLITLLNLVMNQYSLAQAQNGQIRFAVFPQEGQIKIDHSKLFNNKDTIIELSEGSHFISVWAPKMTLLDTNVVIKKDTLSFFRYVMKYNKNFMEYHRSLNQYKFKKFNRIVFPAVGIITLSVISLDLKKKSADYHDMASADIERYNNSTGGSDEFNEIKNDLDDHRSKYKLYNGLFYGTASIVAVATFFYIKSLIKLSTLEKPIYKESNILTKIDLGINYSSFSDNWIMKINYKF
jgi:hypothetical protein